MALFPSVFVHVSSLAGRGGEGDGGREGGRRCRGADQAAGGDRHRKPKAGDGETEGGDQSRHDGPRGAGEELTQLPRLCGCCGILFVFCVCLLDLLSCVRVFCDCLACFGAVKV